MAKHLQVCEIERSNPAQAIITTPAIERVEIRGLCDGHDLFRVGPAECATTIARVKRIERNIDRRTSERRAERDNGDRLVTVSADSRIVTMYPRTGCRRPVYELHSPTIDLARLTSERTAWCETGGRISEQYV